MIKNGRIFGRINILDLLLVLVIVAAVAFVGLTRGTGILPGGPAGETTYTMRFFIPQTYDFVVEHLSIGDQVIDHTRLVSFGRITDIQASEGLEWHPNADGILIASPYEGMHALEITTEVTLPAGAHDSGLHIQGNRFGVGQTVVIRAGDTLISLRISAFEEKVGA